MANLRLDYRHCHCYSPLYIYLSSGFVILVILFEGCYYGYLTPSRGFTKSLSYPYKLLGCMLLTKKPKKTALLHHTT